MNSQRREGMSRRTFGKLSAAAGFAVITGRAFAADVNTDTLRVGLIGCGGRGTGAAENMLEGNDNVVLVAMADVFDDRLKSSLDRLKNSKKQKVATKVAVDEGHCFTGFDAYKKLLDTDVNVVIHGALPYCRPQHVAAIIDAGKHLFTEKPVAVDPEGIRMVMAAADIVEQHVHNLDVMNWVMGGPPKRVFAMGGRSWKTPDEKYGDIFDHFACDYEYEVEGEPVRMTSFSRHWKGCAEGVFEEVVGTKGTSDCRRIGKKKVEGGIDPYVQEHIDLIASIRGTGPYLNEGVQVAESTMTAIMGRMSAYTGQNILYSKALETDLNLVPKEFDFTKPYPVAPVPNPGWQA
ncbi:MAG: Gfo/Idh/MocA family oxidoreductase [Candidatus Hydrogenedentes bacterium]|nr:Gfo/Idh/MocA family oxidoreductase [Candidatus Hydrogenedentota bacterium]